MGWYQRQIDLRALEVAAGVKADHETHVKECRDRYLEQRQEAREARAEMKDAIQGLYEQRSATRSMITRYMVTIIALLLLGYLFVFYHGLPWTLTRGAG
jgi:type VI protein secretion system component VasF